SWCLHFSLSFLQVSAIHFTLHNLISCTYAYMFYISISFSSSTSAHSCIYTLSLHDSLPIYPFGGDPQRLGRRVLLLGDEHGGLRSEEHTSELQSRFDLVCRLLLEKKKTSTIILCLYLTEHKNSITIIAKEHYH